MEKLPHQEFRDDLADKLREIRNSDEENADEAKAKAAGYLMAKQETGEYKDSHKEHAVLNTRKNKLEEAKQGFVELKDNNTVIKVGSGEMTLGSIFKEAKEYYNEETGVYSLRIAVDNFDFSKFKNEEDYLDSSITAQQYVFTALLENIDLLPRSFNDGDMIKVCSVEYQGGYKIIFNENHWKKYNPPRETFMGIG